jgi:phosphoribosyl-ATP pyrophosphohydrolase
MTDLTPQQMLDAIKEGLEENSARFREPNLGEELKYLWSGIQWKRGDAFPVPSDTMKLITGGKQKIAGELAMTARDLGREVRAGRRADVLRESGNLLYVLLVSCAEAGIEPTEIAANLRDRCGIAGWPRKMEQGAK